MWFFIVVNCHAEQTSRGVLLVSQTWEGGSVVRPNLRGCNVMYPMFNRKMSLFGFIFGNLLIITRILFFNFPCSCWFDVVADSNCHACWGQYCTLQTTQKKQLTSLYPTKKSITHKPLSLSLIMLNRCFYNIISMIAMSSLPLLSGISYAFSIMEHFHLLKLRLYLLSKSEAIFVFQSACWAMAKSWLDVQVDIEIARVRPQSFGEAMERSPGQGYVSHTIGGPNSWPHQILNQQPRNLSSLLQKLYSR